MTRGAQGLAQSVLTRLLSHARAVGVDPNTILARYGLERFLYRLGRSPHSDRFVLKGGMLLRVWLGETSRPTRDADLLGYGARFPPPGCALCSRTSAESRSKPTPYPSHPARYAWRPSASRTSTADSASWFRSGRDHASGASPIRCHPSAGMGACEHRRAGMAVLMSRRESQTLDGLRNPNLADIVTRSGRELAFIFRMT